MFMIEVAIRFREGMPTGVEGRRSDGLERVPGRPGVHARTCTGERPACSILLLVDDLKDHAQHPEELCSASSALTFSIEEAGDGPGRPQQGRCVRAGPHPAGLEHARHGRPDLRQGLPQDRGSARPQSSWSPPRPRNTRVVEAYQGGRQQLRHQTLHACHPLRARSSRPCKTSKSPPQPAG